MPNLPSEIIAEVLCRVPARSLLRFRCVSKSWLALIDSPEFIKSHLNRTIETNSDQRLIFKAGFYCSVELDAIDKNHNAEFSVFHDLDYCVTCYSTRIVGSCHGLLCLHDFICDSIEIWNPTTRNVLELPPCQSEEELYLDSLCYGFGYDRLSDDYKVLGILSSSVGVCEARVFSVRSYSWRKVGSFPKPYSHCPGILVGGALHWIVFNPNSETEYLVAVFDLETEEYRLVKLPYHSVKIFQPTLYLLGESLCFCNDVEANPVELWAMKTCGDTDSWTKLSRISYSISCRNYRVKPIAYSRDGRQVIISMRDNVLWYDLHTKRITYLLTLSGSDHPEDRISGDDVDFHICFGSLVRLGGAI